MEGTDRRGLLSDVATAISDTDTDILQADMRGVERGMLGRFSVEVKDLAHLKKVLKAKGNFLMLKKARARLAQIEKGT